MKRLILTFLMGILLFGCDSADREIYTLPENFIGQVIIVYNQEDGVPEKYKENKRLYEIPSDGILKTQFSENDGWAEFPEVYYGEISDSRKIHVDMVGKDLPKNKISACCFSSGSVYKIKKDTDVKYSQFFVGTKEEIDSAYEKAKTINVGDL